MKRRGGGGLGSRAEEPLGSESISAEGGEVETGERTRQRLRSSLGGTSGSGGLGQKRGQVIPSEPQEPVHEANHPSPSPSEPVSVPQSTEDSRCAGTEFHTKLLRSECGFRLKGFNESWS